MKNGQGRLWTIGAGAAFGLAVLLGLFAPPAAQAQYYEDRDRYHSDDRRYEERDYEYEFMQRLMDMESVGAELARAGDERADRPELREFLNSLEDNLSNRVNELQDLMGRRYDAGYQPRIETRYRRAIDGLRSYGISQDRYEIRLLQALLDHHRDEIAMVRSYLPYLDDPHLRRMAEHVYSRRTADASKLRGWLKQWYGLSPDRRGTYE